jgi:hypothetical protein
MRWRRFRGSARFRARRFLRWRLGRGLRFGARRRSFDGWGFARGLPARLRGLCWWVKRTGRAAWVVCFCAATVLIAGARGGCRVRAQRSPWKGMGGHVGKHSCESDATGEDQAVDACELAQRRVACVAGVVWPDVHVRGESGNVGSSFPAVPPASNRLPSSLRSAEQASVIAWTPLPVSVRARRKSTLTR